MTMRLWFALVLVAMLVSATPAAAQECGVYVEMDETLNSSTAAVRNSTYATCSPASTWAEARVNLPGGRQATASSSGASYAEAFATLSIDGQAGQGSFYIYSEASDNCWENSTSWLSYQDPFTLYNSTPVVTGITPNIWVGGQTTSVTFSGQYFGTNSPALSFSPSSGISYSLVSYTNTQIVANITVAAATPDETVSVMVTNNGYGGSSFASGGGSVSPTSSPSSATVVVPKPFRYRQKGWEDLGMGYLRVTYVWESTTGNLADLNSCLVREHVTYPTAGNSACPSPNQTKQCYRPPSPPWPPHNQGGTAYVNPTDKSGPATAGGVDDNVTIMNLNFQMPYSSSSFQAVQVEQYSCNGGDWVDFGGPYTVTREVTTNAQSQWIFKLSKTGVPVPSIFVLP